MASDAAQTDRLPVAADAAPGVVEDVDVGVGVEERREVLEGVVGPLPIEFGTGPPFRDPEHAFGVGPAVHGRRVVFMAAHGLSPWHGVNARLLRDTVNPPLPI